MEKSSPKDKAALRREQFASDFRWLMGDPRGRRLMHRLLSDMGLYRCTFDSAVRESALEMAFREGQKNLGYRIVAQINGTCPEEYFLMMREANG